MGRKLFDLVSLLVCLCHLYKVDAVINYLNVSCVGDYGNYTVGSLYQQNLDTLLSDLSDHTSSKLSYNSTIGDVVPHMVYGLYQCRGDVSYQTCTECIQDARQKIVQFCPLFGEAVAWYYECMLRYANHTIFSVAEVAPWLSVWRLRNVSDYGELAPVLASTLNSVISEAAINSSMGHFATMAANWTLFNNVYCLAQCTPDINEFNCRNCLTSAKSLMVNNYNTSMAVLIYYPNCQLRYDTISQFYQDIDHALPAPSPSNTSTPGPKRSKTITPAIIAGILVGAAAGLSLLLAVLWFCLRPRMSKETSMALSSQPEPPPPPKEVEKDNLGEAEFVQYDFATMKSATGDFSTDNKLGEGGFGMVYKGTLKSGEIVAIKRLSGNSRQGAKEFMTEARLVAKLQHRNLVKLLGFCIEGDEKLLVYEFLPNTSLDSFLFADTYYQDVYICDINLDPRKRGFLNWETRYKVIMGVARGIQYLHEDSRLTIIHRDLKPSNILLDRDMNPKIADFGMARLFGQEQKLANTTRIVGTHGYMAPEYILTGEYSDKSDVYSFGIIILELVSGQKNRILYQSPQREDLTIHAWRLWNEDRSYELVDTSSYNSFPQSEVMRCIQIGLLCVQQKAVHRPTMAAVVIMLTGSVALPSPSAPALPTHHFIVPTSSDDRPSNDQSATKSVLWRKDLEQDLYPR